MQKTTRVITAAVLVAAVPRLLLAADAPAAPAPPAAPALADVLTSSGIAINGYIAASYYTSNGYPLNVHQFDIRHDTFQLDQAGLTVAYQPKTGFGALVDVIAGEDAKILHFAEDGNNTSVDVKQAFLQYATGPLTLIAGKFVTLAGAEVISPTLNTNFSRSLLFTFNEPLTHTGVRATYAVNDTFSVIGGVNNGWNTTSMDFGSKTGEVGVAWTPNKIFSLTAQGYFGKYGQSFTPAVALAGERTLIDLVATYNATSALTLILNVDWNQQDEALGPGTGTADWTGIAGYINYAINDQWRTSLRLEYDDDKDGYLSATGKSNHVEEATLTFGYAPTKNFELRIEGRYDKAGSDLFFRTNPVTALMNDTIPVTADNLFEFALQGVYKFPGM
jgi:hypothetical protein